MFCLDGLLRSNFFYRTCATCNILSDFSYTYTFVQLLENGQVDSAETAEIAESPQIFFPSRINYFSVHGNKPHLVINIQISTMFNIPAILRIHSTKLIRRNNGNVYVLKIFHFSFVKS